MTDTMHRGLLGRRLARLTSAMRSVIKRRYAGLTHYYAVYSDPLVGTWDVVIVPHFVPMHTGSTIWSTISRWFVVSGQVAVLMVLRTVQATGHPNHASRDRNSDAGPRCLLDDM